MVTEKNNMHDVDTFMFFKWFFKAWVAVYLVTHTFDITMAVFDVAQRVVSGAAGVIGGNTNIDVTAALSSMQDGLNDMEIPELLLLALGVPGFLVPGILGIHMIGIMLIVIHPLNFLKTEIRLLRAFPKVVGCKAPVTVPVHILSGTLSVNVFAIFYIEPTVIVPGIVSAMLPRSSIVSC